MSVSFKNKSIIKELYIYLMNFKYAVRFDKILLTINIIRDYLQLLILKKIPLRYVDIALDYNCNLSCIHCSAEKLKKDKNERQMGIGDYKKLAKQCHKMGVLTVGFTGGEPLIYPYLEQVIMAFKPSKTMVSIKTNGILLNNEWLKKLKSWKVDSISIGLGPVPNDMKDYDDIRGLPDSYKKAFTAAQKAKEYGFKVIIGVVVSHENIYSPIIEEILKITKKMGIIFIFGLAVPAGKWNGNKDIILSEDDRIKIHELLMKYKHARTDFDSNFMTRGCGAMNEKLYITPYGDVMPCPFLQIGFGNVLKESLLKIRKRGLSYPVFKGYPKKCLAADHYEFIDDCISYTFDAIKKPVFCNEIQNMNKYAESGNKIK